MSVQRSYERYLQDQAGIRKTRGIPNQFARHIIKKGVAPYRLLTKLNITKRVGGPMVPKELHATKGWRNVPAWS